MLVFKAWFKCETRKGLLSRMPVTSNVLKHLFFSSAYASVTRLYSSLTSLLLRMSRYIRLRLEARWRAKMVKPLSEKQFLEMSR